MLNWPELIYNAPLGHKARNKRAACLLQDLLQGHTANSHGIAGASPELDQTANQGAWRFLDSKHLSLPSLYQPVHAALAQKIPVGQRAYILHDRKEDLCSVGDGRGYGYELFSSLVLDGEGKPLGCHSGEAWDCSLPPVRRSESPCFQSRAASARASRPPACSGSPTGPLLFGHAQRHLVLSRAPWRRFQTRFQDSGC